MITIESEVKVVWGMYSDMDAVVTNIQGKNVTVMLAAGFETVLSTDHIEEIKPEIKPEFEKVIARTLTGTKTHLAKKYSDSSFLFVTCGVVKDSGTTMIALKGEADGTTITCEKCRAKWGL